MAEKCFCHLNGYQVKDAVARRQLEQLNNDGIKKVCQLNGNKPMCFWVGTQEEYSKLETIHDDCFYIITDDESVDSFKQYTLLDGDLYATGETLPIETLDEHDVIGVEIWDDDTPSLGNRYNVHLHRYIENDRYIHFYGTYCYKMVEGAFVECRVDIIHDMVTKTASIGVIGGESVTGTPETGFYTVRGYLKRIYNVQKL